MQKIKMEGIRLLELITFLISGFLFTYYVLSNIYKDVGIDVLGNVWVNWFGVSYFFFVLYNIVAGLLIKKNAIYFTLRLKSKTFWFLFVVSIYTIFIPFAIGENPF